MQKILFFDTETTGLPRNWKAPFTDFNNWPRLVQLAFQQFDTEGGLHAKANFIIKPNGFQIPKDATRIHRISTEKALAEGHDLQEILEEFHDILSESDILVAHNFDFDKNIIGAEFARAKMDFKPLLQKKKICTMKDTLLPNRKWLKLEELYEGLFRTRPKNAHDASIDVEMTVRCFWKLLQLDRLKY